MKISAGIKSGFNRHEVTVETNGVSKEMNIAPKPTGYGSSINGGELLLFSLATCFCNDIYREAAKRNIHITGVDIAFDGDFGADGGPGSNFIYRVNIISDAPAEEIETLVKHTDRIAEIHNTLRNGLDITIVNP